MRRYVATIVGETVLRVTKAVKVADVLIEPHASGFKVTKWVEAENIKEANNEAERWAVALSEAVSLVKHHSARFTVQRLAGIPEPHEEHYEELAHARSLVRPMTIPVMEDELKQAVSIIPQIKTHDSDDDPVRRALSWYVRGMTDPDLVDKFVDYWIGMETLSSTYKEGGNPEKCPTCEKMTEPPVRRRIEGLLRDLQVSTPPNEVKTLYSIRVRLFHNAKAMNEAKTMQSMLSRDLRECLVNILRTP